jgi:hypothetical protein
MRRRDGRRARNGDGGRCIARKGVGGGNLSGLSSQCEGGSDGLHSIEVEGQTSEEDASSDSLLDVTDRAGNHAWSANREASRGQWAARRGRRGAQQGLEGSSTRSGSAKEQGELYTRDEAC